MQIIYSTNLVGEIFLHTLIHRPKHSPDFQKFTKNPGEGGCFGLRLLKKKILLTFFPKKILQAKNFKTKSTKNPGGALKESLVRKLM